MVGAMVLQVSNITRICEVLFAENEVGFVASLEFQILQNWLTIEVIIFLAGMFANSAFLFIRGFVKEKIDLSVQNMKVDHKSDYLESKQMMMMIVITFVVPCFYLTWIRRHIQPHFPDDKAEQILEWQLPCALFQGISVLFLFFISFRSSPWPENR